MIMSEYIILILNDAQSIVIRNEGTDFQFLMAMLRGKKYNLVQEFVERKNLGCV